MATAAEIRAMRRAIELARAGIGATNPNPSVGAVLLDPDGIEIASGVTQAAGNEHAEVCAIAAAGARSVGATLVVTLEPCRHQGRTGPCTSAVVDAGIRRVVYAVGDPHRDAAGGGDELARAGLSVESGVLDDEAAGDLEPWLVATRRRRPFVTWKYAATLDGRTAAADGTSRWVTGPESRKDVHAQRLAADAVVVGIGTVLADDTRLTVRDVPASRQPLRVVVDGKARTPTSARILDAAAPTLIAVGTDADPERVKALRDTGADIVELPRPQGRIEPAALLACLHDRGVNILLLEGGATLAGSFVAAGLVDRVIGYYAPALLGAGPPVLGDTGLNTIGDALRLQVTDVARTGDDVCITARLEGR